MVKLLCIIMQCCERNKIMKKLLAIFLALIFVLSVSLISCGGEEDEADAGAQNVGETSEVQAGSADIEDLGEPTDKDGDNGGNEPSGSGSRYNDDYSKNY